MSVTDVSERPVALQFLLTALTGADPRATAENMREGDWEQLLAHAHRHRVSVLLQQALARYGLLENRSPDIRTALTASARRATFLGLEQHHALSEIVGRFNADATPLMLLKGAHLAHTVYQQPACREMVDLDLLVRAEDMPRAIGLLEELRFVPTADYALDTELAFSQHITPFRRGRVTVELHWRLHLNEQPHHTPLDSIWQRAEPIRVKTLDTLGLGREDLIIHLCVHAASKHTLTVGLRPLLDVRAAVGRGGISWRLLLQRCDDWHARRPVALVLLVTHRLLGLEIPGRVERALNAFCDQGVVAAACERAVTLQPTMVPPIYARWAAGRATADAVWASLACHLSRTTTAHEYGLSTRSPVVPLLFVPRLVALLGRHGLRAARWILTQSAEKDAARDQDRLTQWLHHVERSSSA
ncbi:MAG TPA: nucleotidyltransferase family protein [Vicinamibacterales bacterium]|nr:nucleotidyltransferase family protein [Vicinamibacterales bacterium]